METLEIPTIETQTSANNNYLMSAYTIAKDLAKNAIWNEEEGICNWQGASTEAVGGKYAVVTRTFGSDLYSGLTGIALFLAEVSIRIPDPIIEETLKGAIKNVLKQTKANPSPSLFGFHSGRIGTGYGLWKIGVLTQNNEWRKAGLKMLKRLRNKQVGDQEVDIISGAAGAIPVFLKVNAVENDTVLLEQAEKCAKFLLNKADKGETSWSWKTIPGSPGLTGFSHGTAGIATAFAELYTVTQNPEYWTAAAMAFQYERENFVPQENNWPDLREGMQPHQGHHCCEMWCHGAPGIALSRLRAYQLTGRNDFLHEALVALDTTYKSVTRELQDLSRSNFCLCHGLAGNADILMTGGLILNNPSYIEIAKQVGHVGSELYEKTGTDWPSGVNDPTGATRGMEPTPGLMLGSAGTGYFYLRLAFPNEVENILMIH